MREKLATGGAVGADGRHSLRPAHDRCPVCGSTEAHCRNMRGESIAPHQARLRDSTSIAIPDHLALVIDDLARRAAVAPVIVFECLIWRAMRRLDRRIGSPPNIAAWQRIAAVLSSHPRHTETR